MTIDHPKKIKVCLVDDHSMLRDSLAKSVNSFDGCEVIFVAGNGKELIEALSRHPAPDIIILDIAMPEMDGNETAHWLAKHRPEIKVLILTMYDSSNLVHLLKSGVRGFVKKDAHPSELNTAIHAIIKDGVYCSQAITGKLFNIMKDHGSKHSAWRNIVLSEVELTFLRFVSTEMTYKEIAEQMHVSPRTIDNYRDALFLKLHVKSRIGLVVYAVKSGIVTI